MEAVPNKTTKYRGLKLLLFFLAKDYLVQALYCRTLPATIFYLYLPILAAYAPNITR